MLALLLEADGRVLSKSDLMERLWPDTFVEEANLSHQIYKLREALGEEGARFIETVPRRGYRFAAPATPLIEPPPFAPSADEPHDVPPAPVEGPPAARTPRPWALPMAWTLAVLLGGAALFIYIQRPAPAPKSSPAHLIVELSAEATIVQGVGPSVVLSPDGAVVAFRGRAAADEKPRIFIRRMNQNDARPLPGTEGVGELFFSPDGLWIGFSSDGKLRKVPAAGGDVVTLCDVSLFRGGDWGPGGEIVFASSSRSGLSRIRDSGGQVVPVTTLDVSANEITHRFPQVLPDGRTVLFTVHSNSVNFDDASIVAQSLDGGAPKVVLKGGYAARYVASGHLLYARAGKLFAVPFDLKRLEVTGPPMPFIERLAGAAGSAGAQFSVSRNGTLIYLEGAGQDVPGPLVWVDAAGGRRVMRAPAAYLAPRISPDGRRVAVQVSEGGSSRIWILDIERDVMARLTSDPRGDEVMPLWSRDGRRVIFSSDRDAPGLPHLFSKDVGGSDSPRRLTFEPRTEQEYAGALLSNGTLVFAALNERQETYSDILKADAGAPTEEDGKGAAPVPVLHARYGEAQPAVSVDDGWLAYTSNETGRAEVFVQRFPELGIKAQISADGGRFPTWSPAAREIFYESLDGTLMVADYDASKTTFRAGKPRVWADVKLADLAGNRNYDVHPDGRRTLIVAAQDQRVGTGTTKAVIYFDVFDELRQALPSGR